MISRTFFYLVCLALKLIMPGTKFKSIFFICLFFTLVFCSLWLILLLFSSPNYPFIEILRSIAESRFHFHERKKCHLKPGENSQDAIIPSRNFSLSNICMTSNLCSYSSKWSDLNQLHPTTCHRSFYQF